MSLFTTIFAKDIVLDEEAFELASKRLDDLSDRIQALQNNISTQLNDLKQGFQTPAGDKFFNVCGTKLLDPMKDQARVINHVSENLRNARSSYESVFQEYKELNNSIRNNN